MPEYYCDTCEKRNTCKAICHKVKILLRSVTSCRTINEEIPKDFIYQLLLNPHQWPSLPKEKVKRKNRRK